MNPAGLKFRHTVNFLITLAVVWCFAASQAGAQSLEKSGKNWNVKLKSFFVHEDNLAQNPDQLQVNRAHSDSGWNGNAAASYTYRHNNSFSITADYDVDLTLYKDLNDFNLIAQMWGFKPKYRVNETSFFDLQYFYMWNIAGSSSFSGVHYVNPSYNHLHRKWGLTRVHYFFKNTNNFINQARDGDQHGGGLTHIYLIPNSRHYVGLGYQLSTEDTVGRFDRDVHDFKILGRVELPMAIQLNGEYKFSLREYDTFAADRPGAIRQDEQHNWRFRFRKVLFDELFILDKVTARLDYLHQNNQSNLGFRDYKTNRFSIGLEAKF